MNVQWPGVPHGRRAAPSHFDGSPGKGPKCVDLRCRGCGEMRYGGWGSLRPGSRFQAGINPIRSSGPPCAISDCVGKGRRPNCPRIAGGGEGEGEGEGEMGSCGSGEVMSEVLWMVAVQRQRIVSPRSLTWIARRARTGYQLGRKEPEGSKECRRCLAPPLSGGPWKPAIVRRCPMIRRPLAIKPLPRCHAARERHSGTPRAHGEVLITG
jgi:hypothetical protein